VTIQHLNILANCHVERPADGRWWMLYSGGEAINRGVGTEAERDATIPIPSVGDEWFNTDLSGGGKWEKHTGTEWKRS